jgi:hypothetical protein
MVEIVHVALFGRRLVWRKDGADAGPLVPPEQCDEAGELKIVHALVSDAYAHVFADGFIRRYGEVIGTRADLVVLEPQ